MKTHSCCHFAAEKSKSGRVRGKGEFAGWLLSGATLVMMPKCPLCLAAYIALATGIGVSFSTAAHLRILLLLLAVGTITLLLARRLLRLGSNARV
jgi:hypothetical protein